MKLHNALITSALVTAVAAEKSAHLRRLKADKSGKHGKAKAAKSAYSSSYSSYSMSYGPPPNPPSPRPPTPFPTPGTTPPTTPPTQPPTLPPQSLQPTPEDCCKPDGDIAGLILEKVYKGSIIDIFDNSPQKEAIQWLEKDACECERDVCWSEARLVQRYILAVLYFSTKGDNWDSCSEPEDIESTDRCDVQSNYGFNLVDIDDDVRVSRGFQWLTCNSECTWSGANCNSSKVLTAIDIEKNNLGGVLPAEVGDLSRVQVLALEQNNIEGTIPAAYTKLTRLGLLDFDFNNLVGTLINVGGWTELQQLDLNNNKLEGTINGLGWEKLKNLVFLDLSFNKFSGTIASEIGDSAKMKRALFQCNPFDVPLTWVNCPFDGEDGDLAANDNICKDSNCPCSESFSPEDCVLGLGKVEQD